MNRENERKLENGIWFVNKDGFYIKAWKNGEKVEIRAYCENEDGYIPFTYIRRLNDVDFGDNFEKIELRDETVDSLETRTVEERNADQEYERKSFDALPTSCHLASHVEVTNYDEIFEI